MVMIVDESMMIVKTDFTGGGHAKEEETGTKSKRRATMKNRKRKKRKRVKKMRKNSKEE